MRIRRKIQVMGREAKGVYEVRRVKEDKDEDEVM